MTSGFFSVVWSASITQQVIEDMDLDNTWSGPVAVGDFNADGHQDVFLTYYEYVSGATLTRPTIGKAVLLLGDGTGHFVDGSPILPDGGIFDAATRKIAVADFNGDGQDDIAMAINYEDGRAIDDPDTNAAPQMLLLSGGGHLSAYNLDMDTWGHGFAVGDINNDGRTDLILGGFTLPEGAPTATAEFLQQSDGSMSSPMYMQDFSEVSEAIGDFDGDGKAELADFWVDYSDDTHPYGLRLTQLSDDGQRLTTEVNLEHPVRIEHGVGWQGGPADYNIVLDNDGNEFIDTGWEDVKVADVNGDGKDDLVAFRGGSGLNYVDGVLTSNGAPPHNEMEFYTQGPGGFVRMSDVTISGWTPALYGVRDYHLVDWDGDGHVDLFVNWPYDTEDDPGTGAHIFLNDGAGHFKRLEQDLLPNGQDTDGNYYSKNLEPIDANGDGIMDLLLRPESVGKSGSEFGASSEALYLGTKRFYTGPDFTNPALKGAPGFNEQYYLNTHADAASWVHAHHGKTGLDHYLTIGRAKGYLDFAPGTHVYGSDKADKIVLREGNETGDGGKGNDTLTGGAGADKLIGGSGTDTASYAGAHSGLTASLADASTNKGDAAGDSYFSIERLIGSSHSDWLGGNDGANSLSGGSGNDSLDGSDGKDTLNGGAGADHFYFDTALSSGNIDTVSGFAHKSDKIELDDAIFLAIGGSLGSSEFYAHSGATRAHDSSDRIVYDSKTGYLYYDVDGNKAHGHGAVHFATLSGHPNLSASDFHIV